MLAPLKSLAKCALRFSPLPEILLRSGARRRITAVAYHRISEAPARSCPYDAELISATPAEFQNELRYLKRHLDLISVSELVRGLQEGQLPRRPAVITFDDGYVDNYDVAFPLLREEGLSACFFLSTHLVGTGNMPWWDQVACCFKFSSASSFKSPFGDGDADYSGEFKVQRTELNRYLARMKYSPWPEALGFLETLKDITRVQPLDYLPKPLFMSWDNAREMLSGGMEVGGHTRSHPVLGQMRDEAALRDEIIGGRDDLKRELACAPLAFSYPEGYEVAMSELSDRIITEADFSLSFSYLPFLAPRQPKNLWRLPRFHAEFGNEFDEFRLSLFRAVSS